MHALLGSRTLRIKSSSLSCVAPPPRASVAPALLIGPRSFPQLQRRLNPAFHSNWSGFTAPHLINPFRLLIAASQLCHRVLVNSCCCSDLLRGHCELLLPCCSGLLTCIPARGYFRETGIRIRVLDSHCNTSGPPSPYKEESASKKLHRASIHTLLQLNGKRKEFESVKDDSTGDRAGCDGACPDGSHEHGR
eukprot:6186277-Pleurochrysis_carterae.AAC.3